MEADITSGRVSPHPLLQELLTSPLLQVGKVQRALWGRDKGIPPVARPFLQGLKVFFHREVWIEGRTPTSAGLALPPPACLPALWLVDIKL